MELRFLLLGCLIGLLPKSSCSNEVASAELAVMPAEVILNGPSARQRLVVLSDVSGRPIDLTSQADFRSESPEIAIVDANGLVQAVGDGQGQIVAVLPGREVSVTVRVSETGTDRPPTFEREIQPLLTRFGCNAGACHGKARGQNGFQLSLLGFDPDFDHAAITREARGRRIFPAAPDQSLLLQKAAAAIPHGGGRKLDPDGWAYETFRRWIASGTPRDSQDAPKVESIAVWPTDSLLEPEAGQQLLVTATYSDGSTLDVTHLAAYQSNESAVVAVDEQGLLQAGPLPGEAAISARFEGMFATSEVLIPLDGTIPDDDYEGLPRSNFIDGHVWAKLQKLGITPSEPASDSTFLRRASLDVIGRLPTPEEARAFLADDDPEKRARLIDDLLERPEYADHWATKWMDLLRPNPYRVGIKATLSLDGWVRDAFRQNLPYDEFVRGIVAAQGSTWHNGAATVFRDRRDPEELTNMFSQLFLGVRLECAQCHHHPFEVYGQKDFYGFAAYFAQVGRKGTGLSPPISGGEEIVFASDKGSVKHPLTGEEVPPAPLFGEAPPVPEGGAPRASLAAWMTSPEKPDFARVIANRVWADLMVRGLVEPVDDLRATNPATNEPLLDALAEDFRTNGHDLKHLIRRIMNSYAYGLSSTPNDRNVSDTRNFSRHYRQRLGAEALLDAVADLTGVPESFGGAPPGSRATQIWTHRVDSLFLDTFGRPDGNQDPPCERTSDTSFVQALHLMNSPALQSKLASDSGRVAELAKSDREPREIVEELYLLAYSRSPDDEEQSQALDYFEEVGDRRRAIEDLLWALLNSPEFVFKD
ncbi:DUF1549 and DUF1553 domain-containing protein [soil metagenome]